MIRLTQPSKGHQLGGTAHCLIGLFGTATLISGPADCSEGSGAVGKVAIADRPEVEPVVVGTRGSGQRLAA